MEKVVRSRNKFLKFLPPRAAPAITFYSQPFSPKSKDKRSDPSNKPKSHLGKAFSGPIISEEARRKLKNSRSFKAHEPTSPKVSCMGQIKHKKKPKIVSKEKHASLPRNFKPNQEAQKRTSVIGKLFSGARPHGRKSSDSDAKPPKLLDRAVTGLGQIKRLPSRRNSLASFDWTAQIAPVEHNHDREGFSDEESEGEEREVIIPFSAPLIMGGGGGVALEPKKEINLWKRRTMAQPRPLQVN